MPEDIQHQQLISPQYSTAEKSLIRSSAIQQATEHVVKQFRETHQSALRQHEKLGYFNQSTFFQDLLIWANNSPTWEKQVSHGFRDFLYRFSHRENGPAELENFRNFLKLQFEKITPLPDLLLDFADKSELQSQLDDANNEKERQELKLEVSSFYQEFSQFLYRVNLVRDERGFNDPFFRSMETIADMIMAIGKVRNIENENKNFLPSFNGIRAQTGLCRALEKSNCIVLMPDPKEPTEIQNWDHKGNDVVAIDEDGNIFLIDCKGYFMDNDTGEKIITPRANVSTFVIKHMGPVLADTLEYLQEYLKKAKAEPEKFQHGLNAAKAIKRFIQAQNGQGRVNVTKLKVFIPTDEQLLSSTGIMDAHAEKELYSSIQSKIK